MTLTSIDELRQLLELLDRHRVAKFDGFGLRLEKDQWLVQEPSAAPVVSERDPLDDFDDDYAPHPDGG